MAGGLQVRALRRGSFALACGVVGAQHVAHLDEAPSSGWHEHVAHAAGDAVLALPPAALAMALGMRFAARSGRPGRAWLWAAAGFAAALVPASAAHALIEQDTHAHAAAASIGEMVRHGLADAPLSLAVALIVARIALSPRVRFGRRAPRPARLHFAPGWAVALAALASVATVMQARPRPAAAAHEAFTTPLPIPQVLTGSDITIQMQESLVPVLPGPPTKMWTYNGTFPGPTIRRPSGQRTRVRFVSNLPSSVGNTSVHHHGSHSASSEDGQPHDYLIPPGGERTYTYDFVEGGTPQSPAPERAAFQWYHDHVMDHTARNVYMGLAGMVILDDDVDAALPLPDGEFDVPLMIADRSFDDDNQLLFADNDTGQRGDHMIVNGAAQPYFDVAGRRYRFRLLNAANVSPFEFALSNGATMTQIATESGLLPAPVERSSLLLGPAERAEVVVDFSGMAIGESVTLKNLRGYGDTLDVMKFTVTRDVEDDSLVPASLRPLEDPPIALPADTRIWLLTQSVTGEAPTWSINFRGFDPDRVDTAPLNPRLDTAERWIFVNTTSADHLMHIHDVDWRLVLRAGPELSGEEDLTVERSGLKETFLVRPNEVVVITSTFTDHLGRYPFHCHVLEHEDHAMMAQFEVVA